MSGAPDALDSARNSFWRRDHDDEIDRADVDSQFETGRANHRPQFAVLQAIFHGKTHAPVKRCVMSFDLIRELGQQLFKSQPDLFCGGADIRENKHRLSSPNKISKLRVKSHAGVARRWIRVFADWRKNLDDRF